MYTYIPTLAILPLTPPPLPTPLIITEYQAEFPVQKNQTTQSKNGQKT